MLFRIGYDLCNFFHNKYMGLPIIGSLQLVVTTSSNPFMVVTLWHPKSQNNIFDNYKYLKSLKLIKI